MKVRKCLCIVSALFLICCASLAAAQTPATKVTVQGQSGAGSLRGQVADPSGAAIANAQVILVPAAPPSTPIKTQATGQGQYEFTSVPAGQYTLNVIAQGFAIYENDNVAITPNQAMRLNVAMSIEVEEQKVQVSDTVPDRGCESRKQCRSNRDFRQRTRSAARRSRRVAH